ncbi:helix-turn-helix domain-containing protein [Streptococcus mutans]|nr:helix-turn-helix domain-containing protein [Streptococcus mutans]MCB5021028.1 helix-turn-helix domain-containing protein [Streptococcus mutans]MCB5090221.1 helix-turn-helix domain-containing protein [Streptococcus mutans]
MESKDFDYKKLNDILKEQNITIEQLANMTGRTKKAVQPWLNGTTNPHKSSLKKIIEVLHISEETITKEGVTATKVDTKVINETLDLLLDVFLPFFSFYKKNNEEYQLNKFMEQENKKNELHNSSTRYRSAGKLYTNKVTLDTELMKIVNGMKEYVKKDTFPISEMKQVSNNILLELTEKEFRSRYEQYEQNELYKTTAMASIKYIDELIKNSSELQQLLYEDKIFTDFSLLQLDNQVISIRHEIESHLGIVLNIFFSNVILKNELILNLFPKYLYFSAYYLKAYEKSISGNSVHFPFLSDEFNKYLHWKIYRTTDDEFAETILTSIDAKITNCSCEISTDKLLDSLVVLTKPEVRIIVSKYLKEHRPDFSLDLQSLLEEFPVQWTDKY